MPAKPPRGPGRPAVAGLDRRVSRTVTLPASLWQRLDTAATADGITISAAVERRLNKFTTTAK